MTNVALVDDHALLRRGLRELLEDTGEYTVVGEAASYSQWSSIAREASYDILVLDLNLPGRGGTDILTAAIDQNPQARILVFSSHPEQEYGVRCLTAGAMGYLNKNAEPEEILAALKTLSAGQVHTSPELSALLVESIRNGNREEPHHALSEREMQTLLYIAKGTKRAKIAESLALSPKTISVYRSRIMQKLGLVTDAAIATYAVRHQLLD